MAILETEMKELSKDRTTLATDMKWVKWLLAILTVAVLTAVSKWIVA